MTKLVLVRHGQSVWNEKNLFTGWTDVGLTERGREEARKGARALLEAGLSFDVCYTSLLKRAIHTLWLVLEEMDRMWLPVHKSWRLNERHYGALQGLDKVAMAERVGKKQVHLWRRSYDVPPPALEITDERFPGYDPRYAHLDVEHLPRTECLRDTVERVLPYWQDEIAPAIKRGCRVLISAHGNSLRGLMKYLEGISDEDIPGVEIPTGVPRVYELDHRLRPESAYYLDGERD